MLKNYFGLFFLFSFLFLFSFVNAKSYTLENANINMQILSDSSILVSEEITFNFNGNYTYAFRTIPKGYWTISNVEIYDGNKLLNHSVTQNQDSMEIRWSFNAYTEIKTFKITYILQNAITSYDDVSELNWKLWGDDWDLALNEINATIYLPKPVNDPKEIYTFGHPKLDGKIGLLDNSKIILQAFNIPRRQFVELRLVFPDYILDSKKYSIIKSGLGLEKIILEEENYGKQNWLAFIIGLIILGFVCVVIFIKSRSEKVDFKDIYYRDIPYNYSPSVVSYLLLNFGQHSKVISADILNMCLKNKMKLEKIPKTGTFGKDDYKFIIIDSSNKNLSKSEIHIFDKLKEAAKFGYDNYVIFKREKTDNTPNELLLSEFKIFMQKRRFENQFFIKEWEKLIVEEAKDNKLNFNFKYLIVLIISFIIFVIIFGTILHNPYSVIIFILIIPILIFKKLFIKMDANTKLHYLKWKALKKYLKHFSDFNNKEIMDIKLWEKYLVYAIPLNVAKKVQKDMRIVFENYNGKFNSNIFVGANIADISNIASINSDFSSAFSSAMATSGTSGFSSGGGSGGGGGGGGAG